MQDPRAQTDAWINQQASLMGDNPLGMEANRAIASGFAPSQVQMQAQPMGDGAGARMGADQMIQAMIQGAKAGDKQAYMQGIEMGVFDQRLSPAAAAFYAEAKMGKPTSGAPGSILKELADFAKLEQQEAALSDLLPEAGMMGSVK